jgi:hypothetical protein
MESQNDRRAFLKKAGVAAGAAALWTVGAGSFTKVFAQSGSCGDSVQDILNAALTAEQLATTFYYQGLAGPRAANLGPVHNSNNLNYFQAALEQEYQHTVILTSLGATSLAGSSPAFYFPVDAFHNAGTFLAVLDALETAFIGAYLAAIGEFAAAGSPQFAKVAGQFMGTEAEHRVLGRVVAGMNPPNNLILEAAIFECVGTVANSSGTAVGALLPFVTGGPGFASSATDLPSPSQVNAAASPFNNLANPGLATP